MNATEIYEALCVLAKDLYDECTGRLNTVTHQNKTERKALLLEQGMYSLSLRAGLMYMTLSEDKARDVIKVRQGVFERITKESYPEIYSLYEGLDEDEKQRMVSALQGEVFLRTQTYSKDMAELEYAQSNGLCDKVFELKIKTGALKNVFSAWKAWRIETGIYPDVCLEAGYDE
ncbi:MAG: hypothetical protein IKU19_09325 [Clostridia bacterium]|nr:hypothetical protein [Clostridia bacterium]MBR5447537.1 hypothetical protein [Clostridia bacterium]